MRQRNYTLDIIRIFALFCVISVHFFLNSGFYSQEFVGKTLYSMMVTRTFFMICVPLFLMLSGYLLNKKQLSKKYYGGIKKILLTYLLAGIACTAFRTIYQGEEFNAISILGKFLGFKAAKYAWYIEMYIGLFLIVPFLNLAYNGLAAKKQKQALVFTSIFLTSIPPFFNYFGKIVPNWWDAIYPVTYYFLGCYFCEYKPKLNKLLNLFLIICAAIGFGSINFYLLYGQKFVWGDFFDHGSLSVLVISVLTFVLLLGINTENAPKWIKGLLKRVSDLCLGAYLVSEIFDGIVYPRLNTMVPYVSDRFAYYFVVVPIVFIASILASSVIDLLCGAILRERRKVDVAS